MIFEELTHGIVDGHSRQEYQRIMGELVDRGAQGIGLGCTEISLLVAAGDMAATGSTILFDTTALHVDRAVQISLGLHPLGTEPVSPLSPRG